MTLLRNYIASMLLFIVRYRPKVKTDGWLASKTTSWIGGASAGVGFAGLGATQLLSALGFTAVAHSSSATILTGAGGYIAGTYGIAAVVAFITAPFAILIYLICLAFGGYVWVKRKIKT
jgi:hypothetical protein